MLERELHMDSLRYPIRWNSVIRLQTTIILKKKSELHGMIQALGFGGPVYRRNILVIMLLMMVRQLLWLSAINIGER